MIIYFSKSYAHDSSVADEVVDMLAEGGHILKAHKKGEDYDPGAPARADMVLVLSHDDQGDYDDAFIGVGKGVFSEVNRALDAGVPCFAYSEGSFYKVLSTEETDDDWQYHFGTLNIDLGIGVPYDDEKDDGDRLSLYNKVEFRLDPEQFQWWIEDYFTPSEKKDSGDLFAI